MSDLADIAPSPTEVVVMPSMKAVDDKKYDDMEVYGHICYSAEEVLGSFQPFHTSQGESLVFFDTETKTADLLPGMVRRFTGTGKSARAQDVPFAISVSNVFESWTLIDREGAEIQKMKDFFEDETTVKVAHNIKFDMHMLENVGIHLAGKLVDTLVMAKLVNENRPNFTLSDLVMPYVDMKDASCVEFQEMLDAYTARHKALGYDSIPDNLLGSYANADVHNCAVLYMFSADTIREEETEDVLATECECIRPLYGIERHGMKIDKGYAKDLKGILQRKADAAEQAVYDKAGGKFNINSSEQLYERLIKTGCSAEWVPLTSKGNPNLDKKSLSRLAQHYGIELAQRVLDYRSAAKMLSNYAYELFEQADDEGYVHPNVNQCEAATGRMSMTRPTLQNIPKDSPEIRRAFISEPGCHMVFLDFEQVDYRIFVHYMHSEKMSGLINSGYDVHAATAALISGEKPEKFISRLESGDEDAKHQRDQAKQVNFALLFGIGIPRLADMLGISEEDAAQLKSDYFTAMPEAEKFINKATETARRRGWVKSFFGRRRRLQPDEAYKAPNAIIQGTANDLFKRSIVRLQRYIDERGLSTRIINVIHDEVVLEVPDTEMEHISGFLAQMEDSETFECKIEAAMKISDTSWADAEPLVFDNDGQQRLV